MDSGVIGLVDGSFEEPQSFKKSRQDGKFELNRALDIRKPLRGPNGMTAYQGHAAIQRVEKIDSFEFSGGDIISTEERSKTTYYTEFVVVPDSFAVIDSGSGEFFFDLLNEQTDATTERANLDLYSFLNEHTSANQWQTGFYGNDGQAKKGTVFGENVLEDGDIGDVLTHSKLNQLGLEYEYDDFSTKMTITESGYLDLYQPSNLETEQFLQYIHDEILHHTDGFN
ncbi:hypothetical protein [Halostagnicola larsenii]|uniref:hypothetical protein n=1 Tax=Halostagnicola larsenii TaxID=353800 RepID=UPI0012F9333A|nr:hypothetical protein [Halostagnicola larsenii]